MSPEALDLIVKLLNRDPRKRLGAGAGDAEEIKGHAFFRGVNWEEALQRKLRPPKPLVKPVVETGMKFDVFKELEEEDEKSKMMHWTFVSDNF